MSSPSDEELLQAIIKLRSLQPHLGRAKFLSLLKDDNSWVLSDARLKKFLDKNNLNAIAANESASLSRDAEFQTILKEALVDFKIRERNFLLGLPESQCRRLGSCCPDPIRAACHHRYHIKFLLTSKEVKPCILFVNHNDGAQNVIAELIEKCLKPVIEEYKLSKYGYRLQQITHPIRTAIDGGIQHAWIFADTRSSLWQEVMELFLTPHADPIDERRVGAALGYPIDSGAATFEAFDCTEMEYLHSVTGQDICCVTAYKFRCNDGHEHFMNLMNYGERCAWAAKEVGTILGLNFQLHEKMGTWAKQMYSPVMYPKLGS